MIQIEQSRRDANYLNGKYGDRAIQDHSPGYKVCVKAYVERARFKIKFSPVNNHKSASKVANDITKKLGARVEKKMNPS